MLLTNSPSSNELHFMLVTTLRVCFLSDDIFDSKFDSFIRLLRKNKLLSEKHISKFLRYAGHDLLSLENRIWKLTNEVIELEFRKKELNNSYFCI
jgi:hypothetical protein